MPRALILCLLALLTLAFSVSGQESYAMVVDRGANAGQEQILSIGGLPSVVTAERACDGDCAAAATPDCVGSSPCPPTGVIAVVPVVLGPGGYGHRVGGWPASHALEAPGRIETPPPRHIG